MFMPSYLNSLPAYNYFPAFTQPRKLNRSYLLQAQTKYQADFLSFGHLFCFNRLSRLILMDSSELP